MAGYAYDIADIQLFDQIVRGFVQVFAGGIALDAACLIHNVEEGDLAKRAQRNDASGKRNNIFLGFEGLVFEFAEFVQNPGDGVRFSKIIGKEGHARIQQVA